MNKSGNLIGLIALLMIGGCSAEDEPNRRGDGPAAGGGNGVGGSGGSGAPASLPKLTDDNSGITAQSDCQLAANRNCIKRITRTHEEVCARWAADHPKRADSVHVPGIAACDPGETTLAAQEDALRRLNLIRYLGESPALKLNAAYSKSASACAIIQAYLGPDITHYPDTSATCYSAEGAKASSSSQLDSSHEQPADAIHTLLWDPGGNNLHILGHRHALLHPGTSEFGIGYASPADGGTANCVKVFDDEGVARADGLEGMAAFPPHGQVPYQLLSRETYFKAPAQPMEWSIELAPTANMNGARVRVFRQGGSAYEPISFTFGPFESQEFNGLWFLPASDPIPGTYVVIVDGTALGPFGYRIQLERCGAEVPVTCEVVRQDCGQSGYGCYDFDTPYCAKSGGIAIGSECSGLEAECVPGATCEADLTDLKKSFCTPYCDANNPSAPNACATLCPGIEVVVYDSETIEPAGAYCPLGSGGKCDPLMQNCAADQGCYGLETTACQRTGHGAKGAECDQLDPDCMPGTVCVGRVDANRMYCQPYCDVTANTGANACATLCPGKFWDYKSYGVCIPPK